MEKLVFYLIILSAIIAVIAFLLSIGVFLLAGVAGWGIIEGSIVGIYKFFQILFDAHQKMNSLPRVSMMDSIEKIQQPQPAKLSYAFGGGWQVMAYVKDNLVSETETAAKKYYGYADDWKLKAEFESNGYFKYLWYCISGGLGLAGLLYYLSVYIMLGLFFCVQIIILSTMMVLISIPMGIIAAYNYFYSIIFKIFYRCPACHIQMPIPVYVCPSCAHDHTRLWPSTYGVFHHTCNCGEVLAVVDFLGRTKLTQKCPSCNEPFNTDIGRKVNIHIPVVGGPNSGKTNYIFQATKQFIEDYAPSHSTQVTFPDPKHQAEYEKNLQQLATGQVLTKTPELVPHAYNLSVTGGIKVLGRLIYLYDAAGEAYRSSEEAGQQLPYYKYIHGLIFIIDPFSIDYFAKANAHEIAKIRTAIQPSTVNPEDSFSRMMVLLESCFGVKRGTKFDLPLTVVITKADALGLEAKIGRTAALKYMQDNPEIIFEAEASNILVKEFLEEYGMGNLLRNIEGYFSNVRFYACSSLGRLPDNSREPYIPMGVADPLLWVLGKVGAINLQSDRVKAVDNLHLSMGNNIFKKIKYYLWDSLRPQVK
jgi:hypothetical protein